MLSSRTLAFILATVTSPLALAASSIHVPFVLSTVQRPDSHAGRFGLVAFTAYGPYGQKTTSTQVIDLDAYISSDAEKFVVGTKAIESMKAAGGCAVLGLDGTCLDVGGSSGGSSGGGSGSGTGGGINPGGSGPGAYPPAPPTAPVLPASEWSVGTVTYTQFYDGGSMQQTTTYQRQVFPDTNGDGSGTDGGWGPPVIVDSPTKGH